LTFCLLDALELLRSSTLREPRILIRPTWTVSLALLLSTCPRSHLANIVALFCETMVSLIRKGELCLSSNQRLNVDMQLANAIKQLPKRDYALFFITTPPSSHESLSAEEQLAYEMDDSESPLRTELKRDLSAYKRADNITLPPGPLFERFQFLTPGLFMGILTTLLLVSIGYAGVNALGSLQVSYAAFDKENGPQAQRNKAQ
jgi:hypothetical protein